MGGRWEQIRTQVWETIVTPCDCCGQVVAKQLWIADVDGEEKRFCGLSCEALYRSYVLPKFEHRRGTPTEREPSARRLDG
jgi:hypothetical protein